MKAQNRKYHYYRSPKTTQERRDSCDDEHKDLVRPSRNRSNLPTSWDDINVHHNKTWKDKRKQQYNIGGRGKKRKTIVIGYRNHYRVEDFFDKHSISYKMVRIKDKNLPWMDSRRIYIYWSKKEIDFTWLVVPDGRE